ncbi:MAG: helix-turn-helix transcriptional regulator [Bacteroidota bacterium]
MSKGRSQANALMVRIKKVRKRKGYSQFQLAQKLDLSQNAYSKLELGRSNLSLDKLFDIAEILETEVTHFFKDQP